MALKEKALKRLSEKFEKKKIPYAMCGEWMMHVTGLASDYHVFHVLTSFEHGEEAERGDEAAL